MNYPLISEYIESIKAAEDNLNQLSHLRPVLNGDGQPIMSSGNFAVVFKMKDEQTGKLHAIKCFLKEQEGRAEAYHLISEELKNIDSPYLTPIRYIENELFVDSQNSDETEFPVLLMDWVEGETLSSFLQKFANLYDENQASWSIEEENTALFELKCLPYNFIRMSSWLLKQTFAHGDIKPDNIIVREDGTCVLIDYDGMYVSSMQGVNGQCIGTPNYRHPLAKEHRFDKNIDNYSISIIALSLCAYAIKPNLINGSEDCCIITEKESIKLHEHNLLKNEALMSDNLFKELLSIYMHVLSQNKLGSEYFDECISDFLCPNNYDILCTESTEYEKEHYWEDKYGVRYSLDGRKVICASKDLKYVDYKIREGVLIVCDSSFQRKSLKSITLPDSVVAIGAIAFANNDDMEYCNIPSCVKFINENNPWGGCFNIKKMDCSSPLFQIKDGILYSSDLSVVFGFIYWNSHVIIDYRTKKISANAFWSSRDRYDLFIKEVVILNDVEIGYSAFFNCKSAIFNIAGSVNKIGSNAFYHCERLEEIKLTKELVIVDQESFIGCKNLQYIVIPNSVTEIGKEAFKDCTNLKSIVISESVTNIGEGAFQGCHSLQNIEMPNSVTEIKKHTFKTCKNLQFAVIPNSVKEIGEEAFSFCESLQSINIPESVTKIERGAFSYCHNLQSIEFPLSVTEIGAESFECCRGLRTVNIPKSLTKIGENAFERCTNLQSIVVAEGNKKYNSCNNCNAIIETATNKLIFGCETTQIPDTVKEIGARAFQWCKGLKTINIPKSVAIIGKNAFYDCSNLEFLAIPNSIKEIGTKAFVSCTSLKSIVIPESVTKIGEGAFSGCSNLESIVVAKGNKKFNSRNNCNAIIETATKKMIVGCATTNIPNSVTQIGEDAFYGCKSLQSIFIPDSITQIGDYAFRCCSNLECLVIPNSVKEIGAGAFLSCTRLKSIVIPKSVTKIGERAFSGCSNLECLVIPNSVTEIGEEAFKNCGSMQSIDVAKGNKKYDSRNNCNAIIETASNKLIVGCATTYIPETVIEIGKYAFDGSGLRSIVIPDSVTRIGDHAFYGCKSLQSIVIPNSVTQIRNSAFNGCSNLECLVIPNSVKGIGFWAFESCISLKSIVIPESVTEIGEEAFKNCGSMQSIDVAKGNKKYDSRNNCNAIIETASNKLIVGCATTHIPNSVTQIENYAFNDCNNLQSIFIPESVTEIGNNAFRSCSNLESIVVAKGNKKYDSRNNCNAIIETASNKLIAGCATTHIPETVIEIGEYAFDGSGLRSIVIPDSVTQIGDNAFNSCSNLESIIVTKGNKKYDSRNNCNAIIETAANKLIVGCATTHIPETVIKIGAYAFSGRDNLHSIVIPDTVTIISDSAFWSCHNLQSIVIPKGSKVKFEKLLPLVKRMLQEQ